MTRKSRLTLTVCASLAFSLLSGFVYEEPSLYSLKSKGTEISNAMIQHSASEIWKDYFSQGLLTEMPEEIKTDLTELANEKEQAELEAKAAEEAKAQAQAAAQVQPEATAPVQTSNLVYDEQPAAVPAVAAEQSDAQPVDNGIWSISYCYSFGAADAPADGSIGLWAEGWFIVHDYMPNGQKITSLPAMVEVDGQIYRYSTHWYSGMYITTEEVARVRANGGITFQTCSVNNTNLMVHYDPVGGAYPYSFENYPYCSSDTEAVGYYREDYE